MSQSLKIGCGVIGMAAAVFAAGALEHTTTVVRPEVRSGKPVSGAVVTSQPVAEHIVCATVVVSNGPAAFVTETVAAVNINEAVERIAAEHALPASFVRSVIKVESNYNPNAITRKGAIGLMQLMPATARRFGVADVFDTTKNIEGRGALPGLPHEGVDPY